jgi:uncharacterized damage-inducible protein DinB
MDVAELLAEIYDRIPGIVEQSVADLSMEQLLAPPTAGANPIGWLVWHIGRVQDAQISPLMGVEQLWATGPWAPRFGLDPDPANMGYGHSAEQVAAVRPDSVEVLIEHLAACQERSLGFISAVTSDDLDSVVDERWTPPVTLGVRLVSVAVDCLEHAGQAAYLRGMLIG